MADLVSELLDSKNISYRIQGADYLIKCINPEHEDSNPSLRVDRVSGAFNCFSCGFKGNIFKHFGVLTNNTALKVLKLKEKLKKIREDVTGLDIPEDAIPFNKSYRNISAKTFRHFEVFTSESLGNMEDRLIIPIKNSADKVVVFLGRHLLSNANPRYLIHPKKVAVPTYPIKMEKGTKSIILVEGIFDLMNCYDKGMRNVVCVFGTQTLLADSAKKMLYYKAQGISKIWIMFDGDNAGRAASEELKPVLAGLGFEVEIIGMEEGQDPGILTQEQVTNLMNYIKY